jgi:SanA protein
MKKIGKIVLGGGCLMTIICIALMLICNQIVVNNAEGKVYSDIDRIKYNKVGLLLGTTPQARFDRITNYFFIYRIDAAEQLYKARKIDQILISGDENSLDGVNETECMRDSLVARGIPTNAIILDGKGYRTISSVINANKVYGLKSFTIISQKFHNERAIYQAEHLGLDVENIQAYNAKDPKSRRAYLTTIREYFARVKMFLDLLTSDNTKYVEEIEPINIEYQDETGKNHTYMPDWIVDNKYIEIKGYCDEQWQAKLAQFPKDEILEVLTEQEIKPYIDYVIEKYGKDYINLYE